jgi:hypothetical protein
MAFHAEDALRGAKEAAAHLDDWREAAVKLEGELAEAFFREAEGAIDRFLLDAQREPAKALLHRGASIAGEVAAWAFSRSQWGLAARLLPELRAGLADLERLVQATRGADGQPAAPSR